MKGDNEKTIAELRATVADNAANNRPSNTQLYTIQQKFSLPAACLVRVCPAGLTPSTVRNRASAQVRHAADRVTEPPG